jgi:hypothetical protein
MSEMPAAHASSPPLILLQRTEVIVKWHLGRTATMAGKHRLKGAWKGLTEEELALIDAAVRPLDRKRRPTLRQRRKTA